MTRSTASRNVSIANTGVAVNMTTLTAYMPQTKSGNRIQVIPGARRRWIVTTKFSAVIIVENPLMNTAIIATKT